ncbi:MAG: extracellular solute-binding protein [Candidatus Rokubacteria bacterium]|nr:extracellular solute-binding protein [Candidatus Rokubacteria bacterium]
MRLQFVAVLTAALALAAPAAAQTRLTVAIGADVNVVEVHKSLLGPGFKAIEPGVELTVVGTGTGEPASRAIYTKIKAQADTGRKPWDLDVALVSMAVASQMVKEGLLFRFVPHMKNAAMVKGAEVKEAFGVKVDGYVVPMFHNQIAIAYHPSKVANPPKTFDEIAAWVKATPGRFGYNGIKGGVSGVGFTMGWVYWKTGLYQQLTQGPVDKGKDGAIREAIASLRDFNKNAVITNGNAGTLDALNRGEIWMGVVWIDQLVAWKNEGRMDAAVTPTLPAPGLPIYPLYLVVPREAASRELAARYIDHIATPEVQARAIVERFGWYPGVDADKVLPLISGKSRELLFKGVSAQDLARYSRQMPLKEYHDMITLAYEELVR